MTEYEHLEIISDSDDCSSDCSECEKCYYCDADLDYEDNEFYIESENSYCCERCWFDVHEL